MNDNTFIFGRGSSKLGYPNNQAAAAASAVVSVSTSVVTGTSSILANGVIDRDRLAPYLPPKVVPEKPLTLDQQVARAQAIVQVTIEAQCAWDKVQIAQGFAAVRSARDHRYLCYLLLANIEQVKRIDDPWAKFARIHEKHDGT